MAVDIKVLQSILEVNDHAAAENRERLAAGRVTALNLISAPGAGKTSLLERVIPTLNGATQVEGAAQPEHRIRSAVLEGDIATTRDAERILRLDIPVVQLLTGGGCHLEATQISKGLDELPLGEVDLVFIENVGNIACPAEFDLGEAAKIGILSVTEGSDKPAKYPLLFHEVTALVLNKMDLLPHTDFDLDVFERDFRGLNAAAPVFHISCRTGEGVAAFTGWLRERVRETQGAEAV
ncbi:MAG: hydrogenase nickel incorporation protein HypB [Actinobacteria bacterium]|nr:hydrogenase nickel incorporation protein HypB [Actinomycetota bacterium]